MQLCDSRPKIRPTRLVLIGLGFGLLTWLVPASAWAGDDVLAESLFREGRELMRAKDFARACPKLAESYRQDPSSGTLLALAYCREEAGQLASAWATYNSVLARARQEGRADRVQAARDQAASLEPRLSTLVVELPAEIAALPGLLVKRDGAPLPEAAWGSAVPVDPGEHSVEVTASGKKAWRRTVTVGAEADHQRMLVPKLESADRAQGAASAAAMQPQASATSGDVPAAAADSSSSSSSGALRKVALAAGAVGLVGAGVGVAFGVRAKGLDADSTADGHCTRATGCDAAGYRSHQDALDAARWSTVLCVAGGALLAGGVTLYFVAGSKPASRTALGFSAVVAHNAAGIAASGGF